MRSKSVQSDSQETLKELGRCIRLERQRRGLNQTELALLSETSINFIGQVEAGKMSAHIGKVLALLRTLGIQLEVQRGSAGIKLTPPFLPPEKIKKIKKTADRNKSKSRKRKK